MSDNNWMKKVTKEMLPNAHLKLAEVIGVELALKLCWTFGGEIIHIQAIDSIYRACRIKIIKGEFKKGIKTSIIACKHKISIRRVQQIIYNS